MHGYGYAGYNTPKRVDPTGASFGTPGLWLTCLCGNKPWEEKCTGMCAQFYAPPLPPPGGPPGNGTPCNYGLNDMVCVLPGMCWYKRCVCLCAGDSPGMNCVRGCIQCATNSGAPSTWQTEFHCKEACGLTENEYKRLDCCINKTVNQGGCSGGGWIGPSPPFVPPPGSPCMAMPIP
jgi:hypothetical protein